MIYIYSYAAMHVLSNTSPSCRSAMPVSNTSGGGSTGAAPSSEALEAGTKASGWRKAGMVWFMMKQNLVGGLEHGFYMFLFFPYIGNVIIPSDFHIFQRGGWNHQPETIEMDDNWGVYPDGLDTCINYIYEDLFAGDYLWIASQSELDMNADILKMDSVWFSNVISSPTSSSGVRWSYWIILASSQGTQTWQWKIHNFLMIVPWTFIYNHL